MPNGNEDIRTEVIKTLAEIRDYALQIGEKTLTVSASIKANDLKSVLMSELRVSLTTIRQVNARITGIVEGLGA